MSAKRFLITKGDLNGGFTLIEVIVAMVIGSIVMLSAAVAFQWEARASLQAREQVQGTRLAQLLLSKLQTMDFYQVLTPLERTWLVEVHPLDSSLPNFGFQPSYTSPVEAVLQEVQKEVLAARLTHFTIDLEFVRRDSSDNNRNDSVMDLIDFSDEDGNLIDDFDPKIRFFDADGDGFYYSSYQDASSGKKISETPDTHIRRVTIGLWKGKRRLASHVGLITLEKLTGVESPSTESPIKFYLAQPGRQGGYLYRRLPQTLAAARDLRINKPATPGWVWQADTLAPLRLAGYAEPLGSVCSGLFGYPAAERRPPSGGRGGCR
jgi:prepilin-type N-terminal cleavage/methylation domain-containing protein